MTLAFSTKSGQWTTEYSFEPTCYANTDGRMIAFKDKSSGSFWLHDVDDGGVVQRNKFYNASYKSKLSMVSNEDPSATKAYEAISLETYFKDWSVDVETINQKGSVVELFEREDDQYAPIPKNNTITSANLIYVGTASSSDLEADLSSGSLQLSSMSGNIATGRLFIRDASSNLYGFYASELLAGETLISVYGPAVDLNLEASTGALSVSSFNEASRSLVLTAPETTASFVLTGFTESSDNRYEVYVGDESSGESMTGDYLVINIETKDPSEEGVDGQSLASTGNFELYAINVDQHKVNLDHSLGQNN